MPVKDEIVSHIIRQFGAMAVPCFMFISFFFMGEDIRQLNFNKLKNRLLRLYIPIFFWNVFYWAYKNILFLISKTPESVISINILLKSLMFAACPGLADQLWFLFAQIVIIIALSIAISYSNDEKNKTNNLVFILIGALIIQYAGVNYELFSSSSDVVKYSLGRCIECIPYAVMGLLFSWHIYNRKSVDKIVIICMFAGATVIARLAGIEPDGFGYCGIYLFLASTTICAFAFSLPDIIIGKIRYGINYIGACTMGIYCMHVLVGWILQKRAAKFDVINSLLHLDTLCFDILIFLICLVVTMLIKYLNNRLKWKWIDYTF